MHSTKPGLIRVTKDRDKAYSILKMVETTIVMIKSIDKSKFPSNVIKEYYEVIRELASILLLLDGYRTIGERAHKNQIEYLRINYGEFSESDIFLMDELRVIRNRIAYNGFFVKEDYVDRKIKHITSIIEKLGEIVENKLK